MYSRAREYSRTAEFSRAREPAAQCGAIDHTAVDHAKRDEHLGWRWRRQLVQ
jgi:hypothetical protein